MREIVLDGERLLDRPAAHAYLKEALGLPEWYGRNLDALHDCLGELSGVRLLVRGAGALTGRYSYGRRILRVLLAAAEENPGLTVTVED